MSPLPVQSPDAAPTWWVVCLCAAWCNTCTDYRSTFDAIARDWPQLRFEWLDIEDDSDIAGDLDVETFPTVLVADGQWVRFFGPLLPQAGVLARLIASLHGAGAIREESPSAQVTQHADANAQAQALFESLREARG